MGPESLRTWWAQRRFDARVAREVRPREWGGLPADAVVHPPLHAPHPERIFVGPQSYILAGATITVQAPGAEVRIGARTYLGRDLTIVCAARVSIGDDVMGSDRLVFADTGPRPGGPGALAGADLEPARPVVIGDGVFLGTGAVVLAGVTVGPRTLVGAGAVLTHDVPANCVVAGNPARIVRHYDAGRGVWVEGAP